MFSIILSLSILASTPATDAGNISISSGRIETSDSQNLAAQEISQRAAVVRNHVERKLCYRLVAASRCSANIRSQTFPETNEWLYFINCSRSSGDTSFVFTRSDTDMNMDRILGEEFNPVCRAGGIQVFKKEQSN